MSDPLFIMLDPNIYVAAWNVVSCMASMYSQVFLCLALAVFMRAYHINSNFHRMKILRIAIWKDISPFYSANGSLFIYISMHSLYSMCKVRNIYEEFCTKADYLMKFAKIVPCKLELPYMVFCSQPTDGSHFCSPFVKVGIYTGNWIS